MLKSVYYIFFIIAAVAVIVSGTMLIVVNINIFLWDLDLLYNSMSRHAFNTLLTIKIVALVVFQTSGLVCIQLTIVGWVRRWVKSEQKPSDT